MPRPHLDLRFPGPPAGTRPEPVYYALPRPLVAHLAPVLGPVADPETWDLDLDRAFDPDAPGPAVGAVGGAPLRYEHLHDPPPFRLSDAEAAFLGKTAAAAAELVAVANRRLDGFRTPARAYCGWLLTNPAFLGEHDALLTRWAGNIQAGGLPDVVRVAAAPLPGGPFSPAEGEDAGFAAAFADWLTRWRLAGLAAPYLPRPLMPQAPAPLPDRNPAVGGATVFLPDTFPVPGRDDLRHLIEDVLRGTPTPHLADWHALVGADNRAKGGVDRFARVFVLQHYWAVVHHRYGAALRGRVAALEAAFGRYLVGPHPGAADTVHKDLQYVRGRLGADWCAPTAAAG